MGIPLIAAGLLTLLAQVVLLRELAVTAFGSELILLLGLALWLAGGAAGAALGRRGSAGSWPTLLCGLAITLPVALLLARLLRPALAVAPGAFLSLPRQLLVSVLVVVPAAALAGALFPRLAAAAARRGRSLAAAYALEALGGVLGGASSTVALALGVSNLALGWVGTGTAAALALRSTRSSSVRGVALVLLLSSVGALLGTSRLELLTAGWSHGSVREVAEAPSGRLTLVESQGRVAGFLNDALLFESEGTRAESFAHLALLQHPHPDRLLLLGGVAEGLGDRALEHAPRRLDMVEPHRAFVERPLALLPADRSALLGDERVHLWLEDPRRFLRRPGIYDLILVAQPEPDSGASNRFYTAEFARLCEARLAEDGLLALRLPGAENLWTAQQLARVVGIERALREVFSDVLVLPGRTTVLLASRGTLVRDPEILARRMRERALPTRLVGEGWLRHRLTDDRVAEIERAIRTSPVPANRDRHPHCYLHTQLLWLAVFHPPAASLPPGALSSAVGRPAVAVGGALLLALLFAGLRRTRARRGLVLAVAAAAGMLLENVLLVDYACGQGALHRDLGLLLMTFMAGLAAGAGLAGRRHGGRGDAAWLLLGLGSIGLLVAVLPFVAALALAQLFLVGGCVGALFAWAARGGDAEETGRRAGSLYAADLLGGLLGGLLGTLLLVPALGLPVSSLVAAALAVLGLLAI